MRDSCVRCSQTFDIKNLRFMKVAGEYCYMCTACRKEVKATAATSAATIRQPPEPTT